MANNRALRPDEVLSRAQGEAIDYLFSMHTDLLRGVGVDRLRDVVDNLLVDGTAGFLVTADGLTTVTKKDMFKPQEDK